MNYFTLLVCLILLVPSMLHAADSNTVSSSTVTGTTTVDRTPSTAVSPNVIINNQDVCTTGISGAAQSAWFGISLGKTIRDETCERLKLARSLYGMGMKVASVSLMCQDTRVFQAMKWLALHVLLMERLEKRLNKYGIKNPTADLITRNGERNERIRIRLKN